MKTSSFFLLFLILSLSASAATYTWNTGAVGNWNDPTKWSPNGVPGASDNATINSTGSVVTLTDDVTLTSLTINSGATLTGDFNINISGTLNWNNSSTISGTGAITVGGATTLVGGTLNLSAKTLVMNGGANMPQGTLNLNNGAVLRNAAGSTFNFTLNNHTVIASTGTIDNQGIINKNTVNFSLTFNALFNNSGTVNVNANTLYAGGGGSFSGGSVVIASGAVFRISGMAPTLANTIFSGAGTLETAVSMSLSTGNTVSSSFLLSSGTFTDQAGISPATYSQTAGTYTRTVGASMSTGAFSCSNGTVSGDFDIQASGACNLTSCTVTGTGTMTVGGVTTLVGGTLNLNAKTLVMNGGASMPQGTLNLNNGAVLRNAASSTFNFTLNNNVVIGSTGTFDNQGIINKNSANFSLSLNAVFHNSGTVNINANTLTLSNTPSVISGDFNIAAGTFLSLGNAGGMPFQGSTITNNGTITGNNLIFNGLSAQTLAGTGSIARLELANDVLHITGNQTVSTALITGNFITTIDGGWLDLGSLGTTCGSATCYFNTINGGSLRRIIPNNGSTTFPLGVVGQYNPVVLQMTSSSGTFKFGAGVNNSLTGNTQGPTYVNREWTIQQITPGSVTMDATFQWNEADENEGFDRSNCYISSGDGTQWHPITTTGAATTEGPQVYTRTASSLPSFSQFAIGSSGALPVELLSFHMDCPSPAPELTWCTAQETDVKEFIIEKSIDGVHFRAIAALPATNSDTQKCYTLSEAPTTAIPGGYFRLKIVENNGESTYSPIIHCPRKDSEPEVTPNPFTDALQVRASSAFAGDKVNVILIDSAGRNVKVLYDQEPGILAIPTADISPGVYFLKYRSGLTTWTTRIVKK